MDTLTRRHAANSPWSAAYETLRDATFGPAALPIAATIGGMPAIDLW